jgi:hypothetical protein
MDDLQQTAVKHLLEQWTLERQEAFREQVQSTLEQLRHALEPHPGLWTVDPGLLEQIAAATAPPEPEPPRDLDGDLRVGLDMIDGAGTQGEVLKRLLDGALFFCQRCALFVIKQGIANLYGQRGFDDARLGEPVVPPAELEGIVSGRLDRVEQPGPAYQALLAPLGRPAAAALLLVPLRLRRKTVAVLLADSGSEPLLEHPGLLRALALSADARLSWLVANKEEDRTGALPAHPSVPTQRIAEPFQEPSAPALDPTVRKNAERSARVLVGDIELYFPAKVSQGQAQGNLYAAMKDELERSRASFVERYGAELESQHQIFYKTVVQQLCAGDPNRLGAAPWAIR